MEKRRVAPGWLDVDQSSRMLVPERIGQGAGSSPFGASQSVVDSRMDIDEQNRMQEQSRGGGGEELDRAFGGLGIR